MLGFFFYLVCVLSKKKRFFLALSPEKRRISLSYFSIFSLKIINFKISP